jgi:hypothetical protein
MTLLIGKTGLTNGHDVAVIFAWQANASNVAFHHMLFLPDMASDMGSKLTSAWSIAALFKLRPQSCQSYFVWP